jgi:hypothetical protein
MVSKPFMPGDFPYTLLHDDLHPEIKKLRGTSVKVLIFIMKQSRVDFTHFRSIRLSLNEITAGAGVSYNSVGPALAQLIERQIITRSISGSHPGTLMPLYDYALNLAYETATPEIRAATPKNGAGATPEIGAATPKNGAGATPEIGAATPKNGAEATMQGITPSQPVSPSTEQGEGVACDHDHERDHVSSKTIMINRLENIGISRGLGNRLVQKLGSEKALQWYAYVIDPENGVKNVRPYLYTSCIENSSEPPIHYDEQEIDQLERQYLRLMAADQPAEPTAPAAAPANNGLARLWSTVLTELKPQLPGAFDNTLAGSDLLSIENGLALVQVPTGAQEVCDRRLRPVVLRTLAAVATEPIQDVKFQEVA